MKSPHWPAAPVHAAKISEAVYEILERMIRTGELPSGSRLPSERQLSELFGVSRNSIREAVRELELRNLVERHSGRGTVVLDDQARAKRPEQLSALGGEDGDLLEIMEFRLAVEPPIAAQAAGRRDEADLLRIQAILHEMEAETVPKRVAELDIAFHNAIAEATHNRLLIKLHDVSVGWLRASRREALQTEDRRAESLFGHRRIADAVGARDQRAARRAMAAHIGNIKDIILPTSTRSAVKP